MEDIIKVKKEDGIYDCDCGITVEEWKILLQDDKVTDSDTKDYLCKFYMEPNHRATCGYLAEKYSKHHQSFSVVITTFGWRVQNYLNRFSVVDTKGKNTHWIIPMRGRYVKNGRFEWQLRDELIQAMEELGMTQNRATKHWIIPSNSYKFNIAGALEKFGFVDWKQKNNFTIGDIVYIYSAKPDQAIRYKMRVSSTDFTFGESQSDKEFWGDEAEFYAGEIHNRYCRLVPLAESDSTQLHLSKLLNNGLQSAPQSSVIVSEALITYIESYFSVFSQKEENIDDNQDKQIYSEGDSSIAAKCSRKRNRYARQKCIDLKGCSCVVCGFNFEKEFGELGKGYIHVHHTTPISTKQGSYYINIENDLVPVCPNCHAMLHKEIDGVFLSVEELEALRNKK